MVDLWRIYVSKSLKSQSPNEWRWGVYTTPLFHQTHEISHHGAWPDKRSRGMHLEMPQMSEPKGFN